MPPRWRSAPASYLAKASNGFWHSLAFTTGTFPDPLQINFSRLGQAALGGQGVPDAPLAAAEASAHRPR